ncbi:PE family protein [Mycobacterium gordonae]|uniref:PE family protein n=2 Tax=Mycobacterium gordonae TaxID=1778 RepID=A0A1X1X9U1_MYCGO|nr:PE-PPE domain-containing protein [Mycobacterium gordonae]MCV7005887.1 PE-PPE domain-containing protein [Mycobacterium gordonae]ORV95691.1 PE family protein [Mycobacterium gordonae]
MTLLAAQPQLITAATVQVAAIGTAISDVGALVAGPTTELAAAAADEVSVAAAELFGAYARESQALLAQAAAFGDRFAAALTAAAGAYLDAEAANDAAVAGLFTGLPAGGAGQAPGGPATPLLGQPLVALIMGGTGDPNPPSSYVDAVSKLYIRQVGASPQVLFTPEQLYPLTGVRSLPFDTSVQQGVAILHDAILQQLGDGNHVTVFGYSQSAEIASLEMRQLAALGAGAPSPADLDFVLIGNPMNPNGGLLQRFVGLSLPSVGLTMYGATPDNLYPTTIYTREYDGLADFPRYPLNIVADLNAFFGIGAVHFGYPHLTTEQVDSAVTLGTEGPTMTTYKMIPTPNLPLLDPVRAIPVLGKPLADLLQPDLRVIVNLGYGDPAYGWSTTAANVPTPFGLFPEVSPGVVLHALAVGAQQGVHDFVADLRGIVFSPSPPTPLWPDLLPALLGPPPAPVAPTPMNVVNTVAKIISTDYAVLLPTADILTAVTLSLPAYDAGLFVSGIEHGSLINAIGDPIAANTAMLTMAGLMEVLTIVEAGYLNLTDIQSLLP